MNTEMETLFQNLGVKGDNFSCLDPKAGLRVDFAGGSVIGCLHRGKQGCEMVNQRQGNCFFDGFAGRVVVPMIDFRDTLVRISRRIQGKSS